MIKQMKRLLFILLLSLPFASFGQQHVLFRDSTTIDSFRLTMWVRQLIPPSVPKINPFFDSLGSAYLAPNGVWWRHNGVVWQALTTDPDSAIWATNAYVDSGLASISAGAVDTNNYISSITRLNREIDSVSNIIDSNNTIIYGNIATLQSDAVTLDSAVGVAFGAIADLYDTKADKDTLNNFVLHDYLDSTLAGYVDTTLLNDSLQVIKARDVPYTGAITNVNLGSKSLTTNKVLADTLGAKSSMGIHLHGTGGKGIMVGAGGGGTITFDDYPTTVVGDSVLSTNSSGGLLRYDMKGKLLNYLLKSDSTTYTSIGRSQKVADSLGAIIATKGSGTVTSIQLVGGTNVTITPTTAITSSGVYTISATGGGGGGSPISASPFNMLYKSSTDTIRGTDRVRIDTTDNRLEFANDTTTTAVVNDVHGGVKMWGSNRMGMGAIRINDTVSIPAALQRAINSQTVGTIFPLGGTVAYTGMFQQGTTGMFQVQTATNVAYGGTYDPTNQQQNYTKVLYSTSTATNNVFFLRTVSLSVGVGIMAGATANSGGSGRGTFTFALPVYNAAQRLFVGYSTSLSQIITTNDPSALASIPMLALAKDAGETTLSWLYNDGTGTPVKVSTGITPNVNDVYRLTVYVSPKGRCYMQLEVMNKTTNTVLVLNPTSDIPAGVKIVPQINLSNASTGAVCTYGLIQFIEEIY